MEVIDGSSRVAPLLDTFASIVRANPSAIAIADETLRLSRRDLYGAAMRLATLLVDTVPAGTPVALYLANDVTFAVGALGSVAAGCPHVTLDINYPPARNDEIAKQAGIGAVVELGGRPSALTASGHNVSRVVLDEHILSGSTDVEPLLAPPRPLDLDEPFALIFTSGSTGVPKGVVHSQRTLLHSVYPDIDVLGLSEHDRSLGLWSPSTIAGLRAALSALLSGATSIVRDPRSGLSNVIATMRDERITICRAVPALVRAMAHVNDAREAMQHLRVLQLGGERVYGTDIDLLRPILPTACKISIGFGSTEAGIVAQWFVSGDLRGVVPCGFAVPGTTLELIGSDGSLVPADAAGELRSTGAATALGFWNGGRIDSDAFPVSDTGPLCRSYSTGDLFRYDDARRLVHAGRIDRMLKIRGQRVDLGDVEAAVRRCAGVREAAVIAREQDGASTLVAFVVAGPTADRGIDVLRSTLRSELPAHMVPADIRYLAEIPHLPGFKPDFAALEMLAEHREPASLARPSSVDFERDEVALIVTRAWNQTLGGHSANRNARWDDAGGDSLQMLLLAFRIERRLGRPVSFAALAPDMRPSELVERLRRGERRAAPQLSTLVLCPGLEGDEPRLVRFRANFSDDIETFVPLYLPWQAARGAISFDAIVDDVVDQIQRNVSERPLLLAGYSFGGFVAHEAARRLTSRGEQVGFVGLIDPDLEWHQPYERSGLGRRIATLAADIRSSGLSRTLATKAGFRLARAVHKRPALVKLFARRRDWLPLGSETNFFFDYRMTWYVRSAMAMSWTPNEFDIPVTLFKARSNATNTSKYLGWRRFSPQLTIEEVDGSHYSMIEDLEGRRLAKMLVERALRSFREFHT